MNSFEKDYLIIVIQQFKHFKTRAEEALQQLSDEDIHWKPNVESNNIAIIIQHISGNMNSRWRNFLTTYGTLMQQPISVLQAIQTEIAHISYHLGQILFIGKQIKEKDWTILSIPKNGSKKYNLVHSSKK